MRIIIAGGGTGGHLFPGIALAEEFQARWPDVSVRFIGTTRGLEQRVIPPLGYSLTTLISAGIVGSGLRGKLIGAAYFVAGFFQALKLMVKDRPDLVVGTGGYVSGPAISAAWLLQIPAAICEQNSIPGLTNRLLGKIADRIFVAFEESERFFPGQKTMCTGNPVRRTFLNTLTTKQHDRDRYCVFILGGNQGARSLNQAMVEALTRLQPLKDHVEFVHQTGSQDHAWVEPAYREKDFVATVVPFIDDIAPWYRRADLIVSRAGAITLTEILLSGKPSILVPYPYAAYNHQEMNARSLVNKGASRMILTKDLPAGVLGDTILELYTHRQELETMGTRARALARPEAGRVIVDELIMHLKRR